MEIVLKIYVATFKKKNNDLRKMVFARLEDLPKSFLATKIIGSSNSKNYSDSMELVWDLEADNFRVFNWDTVVGYVEETDEAFTS